VDVLFMMRGFVGVDVDLSLLVLHPVRPPFMRMEEVGVVRIAVPTTAVLELRGCGERMNWTLELVGERGVLVMVMGAAMLIIAERRIGVEVADVEKVNGKTREEMMMMTVVVERRGGAEGEKGETTVGDGRDLLTRELLDLNMTWIGCNTVDEERTTVGDM
jgi:hypothetical protein